MSKRLAPFTLTLAFPSDPTTFYFTQLVGPIKTKMDIATNPVLKSFLAGSFSGTCSTILFQPLDLVKTRLQNVSLNNSNQGLASSKTHQGMFSIIRQVLKTEHVSGLWRGITPSITRTVPGVGIYFSSLHWLKNHAGFTEKGQDPSALEAVALGMAARTLAGCIMIPITVVKTRFESGTYNYHRISQALGQIYAREGFRGLCCGLVPTLVRDAPYSGLYLMFYTQLKQNTLNKLPENYIKDNAIVATTGNFSCGVVAGVLASLVTHPADVIKTKMQLKPAEFSSVQKTVMAIMQESGAKGFLVGLAPRMIRRTLMSALAWTVYEQIMRQMGLK